jgi:hypothetical protein
LQARRTFWTQIPRTKQIPMEAIIIIIKTQDQRCQNLRYQKKGFVRRNMHTKYESLITYHSKDMANVKVFNKRPMDHITHLRNLGQYRNTIWISFSFASFDPRGPMILIIFTLFHVRKVSCKIQLFWIHSS